MVDAVKNFWAQQAWVQGRWQRDVLLSVGSDGRWSGVETDVAAPAGAAVLAGPVLPGLVNGHSHAFQRAIAGLSERSGGSHDDFWSWRARMYSAALRITPGQLEAIAAFLYAELLRSGYTQVCEFHYLHNDPDGRPYADPLEMSLALVRAAQQVGIGLTLLPTLYMRSGFAAQGLRQDQRRFAGTTQAVLDIADAIAPLALDGRVNAGVALHSLRAVHADALRDIDAATRGHGLALHIHIAEQMQEVDDCLKQHGERPVAWLLANAQVDARWNLVHATQTTPDELRGVQRAGAAIVLCPSTEANLGDGIFDLGAYAAVGGRWSIGSDSHVTRSWVEELRLLEYSQRLHALQRNIAARSTGVDSSAAALFNAALDGGAAATALPLAGIAVGQRADLQVLDATAPALLGIPADRLLDALVFSSPQARVREVFVAGAPVVVDGRLRCLGSGADPWPGLASGFSAAMTALWGTGIQA